MSDRAALLAAILAHPGEDTPRLAYADWLDEHGESARAEFIRVQIELARLREAERDLPESFTDETTGYTSDRPDRVEFTYYRHQDPARVELLRRQAELLAHPDSREKWRAGLPKYASGTSASSFRRGFVGRARVSFVPLLKDPDALWAHHPIEALALTSVSGQATTAKVPRCAWFARVRELSFPYVGGSVPVLAPFTRCPHLADLHSLRLMAGELSQVETDALARSEYLRPTRFSCKCTGLPREAFEALVQSPFASRLRELTVESPGEWALEVLAGAPLTELHQLSLERTGGSDAGALALARSRHLMNLVTLAPGGHNLTDVGVEALAGWPGLASVRALDLSSGDITGSGVEALVASPYFRPVFLSLCWTAAGDIGATALARWPGLAQVRVLDMRQAQVCDTGGLALARSPHWQDLRFLLLSSSTFRRAHGPLHERFGNLYHTSG
jgi:uncharacterized protein (TIGR02996 family)